MSPSEIFSYNSVYALPGPYQTPLIGKDEQAYRAWVDKAAKQTGTDLNPDDLGYDMRGFWKDFIQSGKLKTPFTTGQHFPDIYKTPYHQTFSAESKYALPTAPKWINDALIDPITGKPTPGYLYEINR